MYVREAGVELLKERADGRRRPARVVDTGNGIRAAVAASFGVGVDELAAATRGSPRAAFARQVVMYVACTKLGLSLTAAGRLVGRDRTTAAHACRTIEERREDRGIDSIVDRIERSIEQMAARNPGA